MRSSIPTEVWQQIKAGYATGIGLREIVRKMNVPEGIVLARAKREGWTQKIAAAKQFLTLSLLTRGLEPPKARMPSAVLPPPLLL